MVVADAGTYEVERHDNVVVVRLFGEHDISTSSQVMAELDSHINEGIVVSLTETEFIDSSIVHALWNTDGRLRKRNSGLVLHVATASIVRRVLELSGLSTALPCTGSLDEALEFARMR